MTAAARAHWRRAKAALLSAKASLSVSPDDAASRAYYAAFHAVAAYFALQERTFKKHAAVEAAVHRDLVRPGLVPSRFGEDYAGLLEVRATGDYGELEFVSNEDAESAIRKAERILSTIAGMEPEAFSELT